AESLRNKKNAIDHLSVHAILADGVLRTEPLNFGIGGGGVESRLRVDAREAKAVVDADFLVKRVDVRQLFKGSALVQKSAGLIGGRAQLKGTGNSVADLLATADGTFGIAMSGGRVDTLLNELAELDMVETLRALFQRGKTVELRCAVADLAVRDGVLHSRNTVVDTTETNIKIDGDVNLRDESLDLTLHPLPKNFTPMSLRSPLHLRGSLKHPSVRPDEKLIARGAIAAALGALAAPVAALVPLIDNGPGDNAHCDELIAAMQQHAGAAAPPETPAADKQAPATDRK
ncbi:MAG TPA: AsmA family protein, partial [Candidatus Binatia bacterium]|nr:AsmA family protein [Candidatus Binatia bacterium]